MVRVLRKLLWMIVPAVLLFALPAFSESENQVLFVNVGAADAAVIRYEGSIILVDTGSKESAPKLLAALRHMGAEKVDAVFLTHSHQDHLGGLAALKSAFPVDRVYCAAIGEKNKEGQHKTAAAARRQGWEPVTLSVGDTVKVGALAFHVLGPIRENTFDDNDNSLVLKTVIDGVTYLLTGDMQFEEEQTLLSSGTDVKADVLKVGNHGNRDATLPAFARAVSPDLAVISADTTADSNSAHPQVMRLLSPATVKVTQQAGLGILTEKTDKGLAASLLPLSPATLSDIRLTVDKEHQRVILEGEGDISGAMLLSSKGGEVFVFPENTLLSGTLTVAAGGQAGDLRWEDERPIHPQKEDVISLFDRGGNLIAQGQ